jgi:hypothetical protein
LSSSARHGKREVDKATTLGRSPNQAVGVDNVGTSSAASFSQGLVVHSSICYCSFKHLLVDRMLTLCPFSSLLILSNLNTLVNVHATVSTTCRDFAISTLKISLLSGG